MIYYLNELSILSPCSESQEQARLLMEQFTTVCIKAKKIGYDNLRYDMKLKGICLSENYYVETWLKDQDVETDIRNSFRNITVQMSLIPNMAFVEKGRFPINLLCIVVQHRKQSYF